MAINKKKAIRAAKIAAAALALGAAAGAAGYIAKRKAKPAGSAPSLARKTFDEVVSRVGSTVNIRGRNYIPKPKRSIYEARQIVESDDEYFDV